MDFRHGGAFQTTYHGSRFETPAGKETPKPAQRIRGGLHCRRETRLQWGRRIHPIRHANGPQLTLRYVFSLPTKIGSPTEDVTGNYVFLQITDPHVNIEQKCHSYEAILCSLFFCKLTKKRNRNFVRFENQYFKVFASIHESFIRIASSDISSSATILISRSCIFFVRFFCMEIIVWNSLESINCKDLWLIEFLSNGDSRCL